MIIIKIVLLIVKNVFFVLNEIISEIIGQMIRLNNIHHILRDRLNFVLIKI